LADRRVVVTGVGLVSPLGVGTEQTWQGLLAGRSGAGPITLFDASQHAARFACEVKGFDPQNWVDKKDVKKMDRFIQFAIAAADFALKDSALVVDGTNDEMVGVYVGSGIGGFATIEREHTTLMQSGPRRISPFFIPAAIVNLASGWISIRTGAKGPNSATCTACTTSAHAVGDSLRLIQRGDADAMIAGGSEIYCELVGYGMSSDAYHISAPCEDGDGAARVMTKTLKDAKVDPSVVDYVNVHGTSTPHGDRVEVVALKRVFGEEKARRMAISSTKSMTGHLLGAAGGLEAGITALALRDQIIPPTINHENPDPECDLDCVPNAARKARLEYALSNSFGFGGTNGALLFKRYGG
jgi:3-oxoacyl-[acyl-carrier-protein] synthase II